MSEVRQRGSKANGASTSAPPAKSDTTTSKNRGSGVGIIDVLRILGGIVVLNCALSWFVTGNSVAWGYRPWFSHPTQVKQWIQGPLRLTDAQLSAYDGKDLSKPIYLALNGTIYDVSAGRHMYGPGGSYDFFAGRDASRAFVTGCFDSDLTHDLRGVELMYVPQDDPADDAVTEDAGAVGDGVEEGELKRKGGRKGPVKAELKMRREREYRQARKKVQDTIDGWATLFSGKGGKPYFPVGTVVRQADWMDKTPEPELCSSAARRRPVRKA